MSARQGYYEKTKARGAEFVLPPTQVAGPTITELKDTCGNLIQISQLARVAMEFGMGAAW